MSLHIAAPDPVRATLGTEQPILQSNQTNPLSLSCPAAASMKGASLPNSWTTTGPSSGQVANSGASHGLSGAKGKKTSFGKVATIGRPSAVGGSPSRRPGEACVQSVHYCSDRVLIVPQHEGLTAS